MIVCMASCRESGTFQKASTSPSTPYQANWASLRQYQVPDWFADAKFGVFVHWGVYSVPAYSSDWYPRLMYQKGVVRNANGEIVSDRDEIYQYHQVKYGDLSVFGYKDFIPMFKGDQFDADRWVDLFVKAGAKYVIPVAEHHDGFAMYASSYTRWNAVEMGPHRDVIGELAKASRKRGLKFGASSHYAFNWNYFARAPGWDTHDPQYADLYSRPHKQYGPCDELFLDMWWNRTTEIIDKYEPDILWFDFYIDNPEFVPYHPRIAAYFYNKALDWNKEVVLQTKNFSMESFPEGVHVLAVERGKLDDIRKTPWQTDTSIGTNSWGYIRNWISRSSTSLIHDLVDIVSKNGCLLLNVGPKADGTIPQDQVDVLLEIGDWLHVNGEAIYQTRPWNIYGEGPTPVQSGPHAENRHSAFTPQDIRFTQKKENLYAIVLGWPPRGKIVIKSLAGGNSIFGKPIQQINLLGHPSPLQWKPSPEGLIVQLPSQQPCEHAFTLKIATK